MKSLVTMGQAVDMLPRTVSAILHSTRDIYLLEQNRTLAHGIIGVANLFPWPLTYHTIHPITRMIHKCFSPTMLLLPHLHSTLSVERIKLTSVP